jgi:hypothetical protein
MASNVIYAEFPTLTPTETNQAVGGIATNGDIYCRHCIERLEMSWDGMKYMTQSKALTYVYNCCVCGWRLTKRRMYKYIN